MALYTQDENVNLNALLKGKNKLHPIYLKVEKKDNKTFVNFTKIETNILYAVSDEEFDCPLQLLKSTENLSKLPNKKISSEIKRSKTDKKAKQSNLFTFMKN